MVKANIVIKAAKEPRYPLHKQQQQRVDFTSDSK